MGAYRLTHAAGRRLWSGPTWITVLATLLIALGLVLSAVVLDRRGDSAGIPVVADPPAVTPTPPDGLVAGRVLTPVRPPIPRPDPARGAATSVTLPDLDVVAPVVEVAMTRGSVLTPPDDPRQLGWWASGAPPGARWGSALIVGHSVSTGGGALDNLDELGVSDPVRVRTSRGVIHYTITSVQIYSKDSLADDAHRLFSQSVPGRLVLVTCEDWNGETWLSNAVVIAEPTSSDDGSDA